MARTTKFALALHAAFDRTAAGAAVAQALSLIACYKRSDADDFRAAVMMFAAAQRRERECYNPPSKHDLLMTVLDDLLGTCGVEFIGPVNMRSGPPVEYLNVGDSYAATLTWSRDTDSFRVECMADALERCERKGLISRDY
jgi:hypothetical protein